MMMLVKGFTYCEMISDNCLLAVYQQKIKSDRPSLIQVMIYTPDKSNLLSNADLHLTVINKGRRKPIREIRSITPGVYEGVIELNFSGQSTLEFEVLTPEFKNTMMLDQEINEN